MENVGNSTENAILVAGKAALSLLQLHQKATASIIAVMATINQKSPNRSRVPNGQCRRAGALYRAEKSFWRRIDKKGDLLVFLHFTSLTRKSFGDLVQLCEGHIRSHGLSQSYREPWPCHFSRPIVKPQDLVAMALRSLLRITEVKDLHSQFGVVTTTLINASNLESKNWLQAFFTTIKAEFFGTDPLQLYN